MLSGALTLILVVLDKILWLTSTFNAVALVVFAILDLLLGVILFIWPYRYIFIILTVWSIVRIAIWFGDIAEAPSFGLTYAQFANYLFNPLAVNPPNPPGVPGLLTDPIIVLEILVIIFALLGYHAYSYLVPFFGSVPLSSVAYYSPLMGPARFSRFSPGFVSGTPLPAGRSPYYGGQQWGVPHAYGTCWYCGQQLVVNGGRRIGYCPYCNRYR